MIFSPTLRFIPRDPLEHVRRGEVDLYGGWFLNTTSYAHAFDPVPPQELFVDPRSPFRHGIANRPGFRVTEFKLTETLYADASYWNVFTQRGPSQWGVQPLDRIVFPSQKGLLRAIYAYGVKGHEGPVSSTYVAGARAPVFWADSSAAMVDQTSLRPGVPNAFYEIPLGGASLSGVGFPVDQTHGGVRGRDR